MRKLFLLAVLAALLAFIMLAPGGPDTEGPELAEGTSLDEVSVTRRTADGLEWSLEARHTDLDLDRSAALMRGVSVRLPARDMTVSAETGLYDMDTNDLILSGGVRAVTARYEIITEEVRLAEAHGGIATGDPVLIEGKGFRIRGHGMNASDGTVKILKDVRADFF
jgi:LPS export ABC transporter protein LptC